MLRRDLNDLEQFVNGQQVVTGQPVREVRGHAIRAPQVAAIGDGHAHVAMDTAEGVDKCGHAQFTHSSVPSAKI